METFLTAQSEWVRIEAQTAFIGLAGSAEGADVVYIELPAVGLRVQKGQPCATVETLKAIREVHAPVSGVVSAVNEQVLGAPDTVKQPDTWLFTVAFDGEADIGGWTKRE